MALALLALAGAHLCHHASAEPVCPTVVFGAALAAGLCAFAVVVLAGSRSGAPAVLVQAARWVAAMRLGPLTALVGCAGALPLVLLMANDGAPEPPFALFAFTTLVCGALLCAAGLLAAARFAMALAERIVLVFVAAFRLAASRADVRWSRRYALVPLGIGRHVARRGPSRAPPLR